MHRKMWIVMLIVFGLVLIAALWVFARHSRPAGYVDTVSYWDTICWAKDGQSLYYTKKYSIYRYDCRTHRRTRVLSAAATHDFYQLDFDISPDEQSLVMLKPKAGIYVFDLSTRSPKEVLRDTQLEPYFQGPQRLHWLPDNRLLFRNGSIFQIDVKQHRLVQVTEYDPDYYAADGSGFVYSDHATFNIYYYSWKTRRSTLLPQPSMIQKSGGEIHWKYLSSRYAIYYEVDDHALRQTVQPVGCLDLTTMQARMLTLPVESKYQAISPDLRRFYYSKAEEPQGDIPTGRDRGGLYVYPLPAHWLEKR